MEDIKRWTTKSAREQPLKRGMTACRWLPHCSYLAPLVGWSSQAPATKHMFKAMDFDMSVE